ncbi:MAG: VanW family protein [Parcubacteria group bacterium]
MKIFKKGVLLKEYIATILHLIILISFAFLVYNFYPRQEASIVSAVTPEPVVPVVPLKDDVSDKELLGRAEQSFAGGTSGRNKNIELGISRINGKVVAPGEEFSFTDSIGAVTLEDGFSEERVFLNGEVSKGLGGGLCQVSTTLFQSVVNSGLHVTERHNHSFSVALYDVGLDATYSDPGPDLKFVNDTANPIVIKGRTENQKAIFEIYGIKDGRIASTTEVRISNIVDFPPTRFVATSTRDKSLPECINKPQIGYTAEITYNILYSSGERKEQIFTSKYNPLQKVCYVTADELAGSTNAGI